MIDDLAGIASIYALTLAPCPGCGEAHTVTLSRLGRFAYRCERLNLSGSVDNFLRTRTAFERARLSSPGASEFEDPIMATPKVPTPPTPPPTPTPSPLPTTPPPTSPTAPPDEGAPAGDEGGDGAADDGVGG